jgi:predicted esterase
MHSWYDIYSFDFNESKEFKEFVNINEIEANSQKIIKIMEEEINILNGNSKKLFLGGFS